MILAQAIQVEDLQHASLKELRSIFEKLPAPDDDFRAGFFSAQFIGPWWIRLTARPSLHVTGLPHWQGKKFKTPELATNILYSPQGLTEKYLMNCVHGPSMVDQQQAVYLDYGSQAPRPWRWIRDELRVLNEHSMLCMTVIDIPVLRHFPFPFVLSRKP